MWPDKHKDSKKADARGNKNGAKQHIGPFPAEPIACKYPGSAVEREILDKRKSKKVECKKESCKGRIWCYTYRIVCRIVCCTNPNESGIKKNQKKPKTGYIRTKTCIFNGQLVKEEVSVDLRLDEDKVNSEDDVIEFNVFVGKAFAPRLTSEQGGAAGSIRIV